MNALIQKINFSTLSKGEQSKVYQIVQKAQMCQLVSEKEKQFIADMAARGEQSNADDLNRAWSAMVSMIGVNAGSYLCRKFKRTVEESGEPDALNTFSLLLFALSKAIEPLGGSVARTEMRVDCNEIFVFEN